MKQVKKANTLSLKVKVGKIGSSFSWGVAGLFQNGKNEVIKIIKNLDNF